MNRFREFNPEEKIILRVLLQNHANSVSEIALRTDVKVSKYLAKIEELETEIENS